LTLAALLLRPESGSTVVGSSIASMEEEVAAAEW
jgi:hypothetical protein